MESKLNIFQHVETLISETRLLNKRHYDILSEYWTLLLERKENTEAAYMLLAERSLRVEAIGKVLEKQALEWDKLMKKVRSAESFVNQ